MPTDMADDRRRRALAVRRCIGRNTDACRAVLSRDDDAILDVAPDDLNPRLVGAGAAMLTLIP